MDFTKFYSCKHYLTKNVCRCCVRYRNAEVNKAEDPSICEVYGPGEEGDIQYIISNSFIYLLTDIY